MTAADVQAANLAGTWYPAEPNALRRTVSALVPAEPGADPRVVAAVVPHAAHRYSGRAAGAAYGRVDAGRWSRAVIVAPSHYQSFDGAAVHAGSGFATPLGTVAIDRVGVERVVELDAVRLDSRPYAREHALEIQLPFLQVLAPGLPVVPFLVGTTDADRLAAVADALRALDDGGSLFLVSSDFTHFGAEFDYLPFAADGEASVRANLERLDRGAIDAVCAADSGRFRRYVSQTGATICGRGPIEAFLEAARPEGLAGELVSYYTSLDVTGDYEHSVSYAGIVFRAGIAP